MVNENDYKDAINLMMKAGDSKAESMQAIDAAREFDFEQAQIYLREATTKLLEVHELQTNLIQQEAAGKPVDVNIMLVHAQDHLTTAIMMKDQAEEFIKLYKMLEPIVNRSKEEEIK